MTDSLRVRLAVEAMADVLFARCHPGSNPTAAEVESAFKAGIRAYDVVLQQELEQLRRPGHE